MRNHPRITPIRLLVLRPVRIGRQRHTAVSAVETVAGVASRHLALADVSRPSWLKAPLFARHQSLSATVRHAA